jgi:hypothetical protein
VCVGCHIVEHLASFVDVPLTIRVENIGYQLFIDFTVDFVQTVHHLVESVVLLVLCVPVLVHLLILLKGFPLFF